MASIAEACYFLDHTSHVSNSLQVVLGFFDHEGREDLSSCVLEAYQLREDDSIMYINARRN